MVKNGEFSEIMIPVMIDKKEDARSGVSNLEIGLNQVNTHSASVSIAVMIWIANMFTNR